MKRGVPVCDLSVPRVLAREVWGHAPPPSPPPPPRTILDFWPSEIVSGVKLQKLDDLLLNLVVVFEARRIKGMTPLRAAEAAKQLVICVKRGKIRVLILIAYHYP